jgi:hypothetical protein
MGETDGAAECEALAAAPLNPSAAGMLRRGRGGDAEAARIARFPALCVRRLASFCRLLRSSRRFVRAVGGPTTAIGQGVQECV